LVDSNRAFQIFLSWGSLILAIIFDLLDHSDATFDGISYLLVFIDLRSFLASFSGDFPLRVKRDVAFELIGPKAKASISHMGVPHLLLDEDLLGLNSTTIEDVHLSTGRPPLVVPGLGPHIRFTIMDVVVFADVGAASACVLVQAKGPLIDVLIVLTVLIPDKVLQIVVPMELLVVLGIYGRLRLLLE